MWEVTGEADFPQKPKALWDRSNSAANGAELLEREGRRIEARQRPGVGIEMRQPARLSIDATKRAGLALASPALRSGDDGDEPAPFLQLANRASGTSGTLPFRRITSKGPASAAPLCVIAVDYRRIVEPERPRLRAPRRQAPARPRPRSPPARGSRAPRSNSPWRSRYRAQRRPSRPRQAGPAAPAPSARAGSAPARRRSTGRPRARHRYRQVALLAGTKSSRGSARKP